MPSWSDFGGIWSTLREIDVSAIREEAERPLFIALTGHPEAVAALSELLRSGTERFLPVGIDPLAVYPLPLSPDHKSDILRADLLVLALDARQALPDAEIPAAEQLEQLSIPLLTVLAYGAPADGTSLVSPRLAKLRPVMLANPEAPDAQASLADALLGRLPGELHLAAARRLPGLRHAVAQALVSQTSLTNATYALASGLPEQIPILSIPFAAADILVLTKNQALLVYKLALALGAPPDFQARIREVLPVVGGAYLWRQIARSLIGLVPLWGLVPKVAIAYAGTYTTGIAAWRWYAQGELVSRTQLQRLSDEALKIGRARAGELIAQAQHQASEARSGASGVWGRLRRMLPGGKAPAPALKPGDPPPPSDPPPPI